MNTRQFNQLPKAYKAFPKLFKTLVLKKQTKSKTLPDVEYVVESLKIDQSQLNQYKEICDFAQDDTVPSIFLGVLSQSLQMHMMAYEAFPFPVLGLVHIRNQIKQHRVVKTNEILTLSCRFGELKPHDKGMQFDFITTVKVGNQVVVESLTTYLSRQKVSSSAPKNKAESKALELNLSQVWKVPENIGRRYAAISGDFNFIHLHKATAKAFGFKQAIAHGMWTKAKALAHIELPAAYEVEVEFKLPVFLPSSVEFLQLKQGDVTQFLIRSQKTAVPHVAGSIKAL